MTFLMYLLEQIGKIPATFWGVIIGSFFSLGGVILSNKANDKRLKAQFENERAQRNRDRELDLKKGVYLEASEAITAGIGALMRFSDLELPDRDVTGIYSEKYPCIAKVHLLAREESIQAVIELTDSIGAAFVRLSVTRAMLRSRIQQIDNLKDQIETFERERNRMLELIKQFNLNGETDSRKWEILNGNFEFEQTRIQEASENLNKLSDDLDKARMEFMQGCATETIEVNKLLAPALVAVRTELELPLDESRYSAMTIASSERLTKALSSLAEKLRH